MSISVCPIADLHAPVERVWSLLAEPSNYALWWDAETRSIVPEGPARPGQEIYARSAALGRQWDIKTTVETVDPINRQIALTTNLPLGVTVHNHITCTPLDGGMCRVSFG